MENNECFSKMMAASKQAAKKVAKEKAAKVSCPNCDSTFPNKGALVQHCKYKHRARSDVKKKSTKNQLRPPADTELKFKFRRQTEKTSSTRVTEAFYSMASNKSQEKEAGTKT